MKFIYILVVILLILPLAIAETDESLIKTDVTVKFDRHDKNTATLIIQGENFEWRKNNFL